MNIDIEKLARELLNALEQQAGEAVLRAEGVRMLYGKIREEVQRLTEAQSSAPPIASDPENV